MIPGSRAACALPSWQLSPGSQDVPAMLGKWREHYQPAIARLKSMIDDLKRAGPLDLAVLSVLLRELRAIAA